MMLKRMRRMTLAVVLATVAGGVVALSPAVASAEATTTTAAPTSLVFDGQGVGTTSSEALVTVNGLFEADPFITGDGDFFLTNDCGRGGPGGWIFGSCTLHVTFTPAATGLRTATLMVRTGTPTPVVLLPVIPADPVGISLTGTGTAAGKRASGLKKCEKKGSKGSKARKRCIKKANKLPV
jgi:hypothetical protein